MRKILIVGAGGHGRVIAEIIGLIDTFELVGFVDDQWPTLECVQGYSVLGNLSEIGKLSRYSDLIIVGIGSNQYRRTVQLHCISSGFDIATIIHPRAIISSSATIGMGSVIMAGAVVGTKSNIGCGAIVNTGAVVDHDAIVGEFSHVGVNSSMAGGSTLGALAILKTGSALDCGASLI